MREIKFRAWDKKNKTIVHSDDGNQEYGWFTDNDGCMICVRIEEEREMKLNNIMQYTGLRDKHGKEIYEGDIVTDGVINYAVAFYAGTWRLKQSVKGDVWWKSLYRYVADFRAEIIGNIYENPEILKEGE